MALPKERKKRKKPCYFTENKIKHIDYKDDKLLRRFLSERGKIVAKKLSGTTSGYQRQLSTAIKRARYIGLLPFVSDNMK